MKIIPLRLRSPGRTAFLSLSYREIVGADQSQFVIRTGPGDFGGVPEREQCARHGSPSHGHGTFYDVTRQQDLPILFERYFCFSLFFSVLFFRSGAPIHKLPRGSYDK